MRRWLRTAPTGACPQPGSLFRTLWTCSPLPHLCLYHRIISSPGRSRLVTNPGDLVPGSAGQPHHGEGQFQLQFHSRQRLFAQRLPDSDEPVFRVLLAVGYPVWYEVHLRPLLTCLDPGGAQSAVAGACQSCSATSDTARLNSGVTLSPTANSITPKRSSLPSAQYRSNSC